MAVFLISGVPGAGKTTVSSLLAQRFPKAAHIEGDLLHRLTVTGLVAPLQQPRDEALRQMRLRLRNCCALANNFYNAGFIPILDDAYVERWKLDYCKRLIHSRPLLLVTLAPPLEVAIQRDRDRQGKQIGDLFAHLDGIMRQQVEGFGLWIDSSELTAEATVDRIMERAWLEARV